MSNELPVWKHVFKIAWPLIIANSFWNLQLTIDRVFLGMLSTEALGAAMAVSGIFWVPMALLQQTAGYATTFVAQYFGAKEYDKIGAYIWQAIYICLIGGILFSGLQFGSTWFFSLVGHPENTRQLEIAYFDSISYTALPTALVAVVSGFFTGVGKTRIVIGINLVGLLLNAVLDYFMIFGKFGFPAMGIAGAGYATTLATYGSAFYGFYLMFSSQSKQYNLLENCKIQFDKIKHFLKYGLPSGLQWALEGLAFTVFIMIMGNLENGEAALASSGIAMTIMMLSVLPSIGVAQAVMTLVGQNLGSKDPDMAEKVTWTGIKISAIYMAIAGISFILFPQFYISWFKNEENMMLWEQVTTITPILLMIVGFYTVFDSFYFNFSFALKGAGDTKFVSIVALIMPWPFMVFPTYLMRKRPDAVYWAWGFVVLYAIVTVGIIFLRFKEGKWKKMSVINHAT